MELVSVVFQIYMECLATKMTTAAAHATFSTRKNGGLDIAGLCLRLESYQNFILFLFRSSSPPKRSLSTSILVLIPVVRAVLLVPRCSVCLVQGGFTSLSFMCVLCHAIILMLDWRVPPTTCQSLHRAICGNEIMFAVRMLVCIWIECQIALAESVSLL